MAHLKDGRPTDAPFCCVLSVEPPHFPLEAPRELEEKWLARELELPPNYLYEDAHPTPGRKVQVEERDDTLRKRQIYYAMIENLDQNVGRMTRFLEESGLSENTIVVFLSDHGEMGGAHNEIHNLKQHPWEESVGIPLLIFDPRRPELAGRVLSEPVATEDLFPTFLGLAGLPARPDLLGLDATPLIRGDCETLPREGVLLEFVHDLRHPARSGKSAPYHDVYWRAFRGCRFKYTVLGDATGGHPWQFFDLQNDPCEMNDLIDDADFQDEIARCHRLLRERLIETGDHYVLAPAFGYEGLNLWE